MGKHLEEDDDELTSVVNQVLATTGYDFHGYARGSLSRRLRDSLRREDCENWDELKQKMQDDSVCAMRVASSISVPTTEMFRDPQLFKMVREVVLPKLKEADVLRAWSAGCATGEETYSLAILLKEEGLFDRARIYATDLHEGIIQRARQGVFPLRSMQTYTRNYQLSGGKHDFSKYYTSGYDRALFRSSLKRHITFACHSLVSDSSFNEFDLILCRNVMLYFNLELRKRVHTLLYESLRVGGFLAVGDKETITDSPHAKAYAVVSKELKLYQRIR